MCILVAIVSSSLDELRGTQAEVVGTAVPVPDRGGYYICICICIYIYIYIIHT